MATITPIEGRTVRKLRIRLCLAPLLNSSVGTSNTIWPGHRRLVFRRQRTDRKQFGRKGDKHRCPTLIASSNCHLLMTTDIRFKNQGLDSIEVQDNGDGIAPQNYETVALKHHTSKLSTLSDLATLQTFGFRGEALSSLCALSDFTITTCMASEVPKGTKLEFEVSGKLKGTSIVAAQKGTTASVGKLFNNLPVRRRELERNIKREWNRVVSLLGQYACIQTGVKISVTQQPTKGNRTTIFSTKGNPSTKENIVNVFGAKTLTTLLSLNLKLEIEPTGGSSQRWNTQEDSKMKEVKIVGYVSRPISGEGRQTPDRQMFFVNARPVNLPQIAKVFNEVYKSYNNAQSPFIFANIEMDTNLYDVNVSPDKRTILLHDQTRMLEHLKISLTEMFASQDHIVPISQFSQKKNVYRQPTISRQNSSPQERLQKSLVPPESGDGPDATSRLRRRSLELNDYDSQIHHEARDHRDLLPAKSTSRGKEALGLTRNRPSRESEQMGAYPNATGENTITSSKIRHPSVEKIGNELLPAAMQKTNVNENFEIPDTKSPSAKSALDVESSTAQQGGSGTDITPGTFEEPIPAIISPSRRTISTTVVGSSPSTAKPLRTPTTIATITIGKRTVTSILGTPCPKRPRTENASRNVPGRSSFRSLLSQQFSASDAVHESNSQSLDSTNLSQQSVEAAAHLSIGNSEVDEKIVNYPLEDEPEPEVLFIPEESHDCFDENEKKAREEVKVQGMIKAAEESVYPSGENLVRVRHLLKGSKMDTTLKLIHSLDISVAKIDSQFRSISETLNTYNRAQGLNNIAGSTIDSETAEELLSLTLNKSDFASMKIIGQFNLGFILASRSGISTKSTSSGNSAADNLFIIDQHASDEKFNFERLQATTIVQSQRLVHPKPLELTAVEEEIVIENLQTLESNGFHVTVDQSGILPMGRRCHLVSLPLSRDTAFSLSDLEELISLLADYRPPSLPGSTSMSAGAPPRPSRVSKMFAMRACRSSIMIGRALTQRQMEKVVRHMGEIDKPWNCPHGRPTIRHLCDLAAWDKLGWKEGDGVGDSERSGTATDWAGYLQRTRR